MSPSRNQIRAFVYAILTFGIYLFAKMEEEEIGECERFFNQLSENSSIDRDFNLSDCDSCSYVSTKYSEITIDGHGHSVFEAIPFNVEGEAKLTIKNIILYYSPKSINVIPIFRGVIENVKFENVTVCVLGGETTGLSTLSSDDIYFMGFINVYKSHETNCVKSRK